MARIEVPELILPPLPPEKLPDGKPNPEFFRAKISNLTRINEHWLQHAGKPVTGFDQSLKAVERMAVWAGVDIAAAADNRTDAQVVRDAIAAMFESKGESLLEQADKYIEALERAMMSAVDLCDGVIEDYKKQAEDRGEEARHRHALGKRWLSLLQRVRRLRDLARHPVPKDMRGFQIHKKAALEASHTLRFMIYVYRTDLAGAEAEQHKMVYQIAWHHAMMSVRIYLARNGALILAKGTKEEEKRNPRVFHHKGGVVKKVRECLGLVIICPPRHGKSTVGQADILLNMCQNPRIQAGMLHAKEDESSKNFRQIKTAFSDTAAHGRRRGALFPSLKLDTKADNDGQTMRLVLGERTRDPQLRAIGIKTGIGGANMDYQWWDDPVDKKERDQPAERERTHRRLTHDVLRRLQGEHPFVLITSTLWHEDDAVARMIADASAGRGSRFDVLKMACGGPVEKPGLPRWHALWPEMYPSHKLKKFYEDMHSPTDYAAQYMGDPRPEESRLVKKIAYYVSKPPETDDDKVVNQALAQMEAHRKFLATSQFHLSIDPAATGRENAVRTTDKAGLIYAACGTISTEESKDGQTVTMQRRIIRILDAREFYAGPTQAVEEIAGYAASRKVDMIHIEQVGFSVMIAESVRERFGLSPSQVVGHKPGNKNKKERLKAVVPMLDDSLRDQGLGAAAVEFPGVLLPDGTIGPSPEYEWLALSILDFGAVKGDHAVDAVTQLCKYLLGEVDLGDGDVTVAVMQEQVLSEDDRKRAFMADAYRKIREADTIEEDVESTETKFWSNSPVGNEEEMFEHFLSGSGEWN